MPSLFENGAQPAWERYHQFLVNVMGGDNPPTVILPFAIAARASWDTAYPELNEFLQLSLADAVPGYQPLYRPQLSMTVSDEYQYFLDSLSSKVIDASGYVDKAKLERLDRERNDTRDRYFRFIRDVQSKYQDYLRFTSDVPPMTRNEFERAMHFDFDRQKFERAMTTAEGLYALEASKAGADVLEVGRALSVMGDLNKQVLLPSSEALAKRGRDYWSKYFYTSFDQDLFTFRTDPGIAQSFTLDSNYTASQTFHSRWNANAGASWLFVFNANGATTHETESRKWESDTTHIDMSFDHASVFRVNRTWFKGGLLAQHADKLGHAFWKKRFSLIPEGFLVVRGMRLKVHGSHEAGSFFRDYWERRAGGGFRIGPFSFGGGYTSTSSYSEMTVTTTTTGFEIHDHSTRGAVIAAVCTRPLDLLPPALASEVEDEPTFEDILAGMRLANEWRYSD